MNRKDLEDRGYRFKPNDGGMIVYRDTREVLYVAVAPEGRLMEVAIREAERLEQERTIRLSGVNDTVEAVYQFIQDFYAENSLTPSVREICEGIGINSTSHILYCLERLEVAGLINRVPRIARGIVLL